MARAGVWVRDEVHGQVPEEPTSQAAGTEYFSLDVEDVPATGSRPDRLAGVRPQEQVQRHTVGQVVDAVPGLPALDVPVPLKVEQLADVLSLIAQYEKEMDKIEDLVLMGAPVSTADREAWRRWVNNSSSSRSKRKKKKRRKRKFPKAGGRPVLGQGGCRARCCATTGLGEPVVCQRHRPWTSWRRFRLCVSSLSRSWCANATDHGGFRRAADHGGNHGGDSAGDKVVDMLVIVQRQVLGETEQKTEEVPQFRSLLRSSSSWSRLLTRPLVCNIRCLVQTVQKTVVFLQIQLSDEFVPGQPGRFFEPSMMKSSSSSRAGGGADAGSFTPRC